jgi:7-keto-8-aminopelargonate synthetase-like enzyme
MTEPEPLQQVDRTYVRFRNRKLSYFSGCDYFRMASDPQVLAAVEAGLKQFGLNVAASRLTTGNHALYARLESALSRFFGAESALLTGGGYVTNLVVCQALAGKFSHALIDERAHPSLSDASHFLDCPVLKFRHRDIADVERSVKRCGPGARLLLMTDGMFSHDGSAAPLKAYQDILPRDALILVDDAHGAGVLGKTGKGTLEHVGVSRPRIIQTITLSKAFGTYGGAILSSRSFRRTILERSGLFIGHTPLPLPLANAALRSVQTLHSDRSKLSRLRKNLESVKTALAATSLQVPATPGPIVAITPQNPTEMKKLETALLRNGIFPPLIHYPNGTASGYLRFVISSEHSARQLNSLVAVLTKVGS